MFDTKDNAIEFLSFLNSQHNSIKFAIEFEEDIKIPFLDILIFHCVTTHTHCIARVTLNSNTLGKSCDIFFR